MGEEGHIVVAAVAAVAVIVVVAGQDADAVQGQAGRAKSTLWVNMWPWVGREEEEESTTLGWKEGVMCMMPCVCSMNV